VPPATLARTLTAAPSSEGMIAGYAVPAARFAVLYEIGGSIPSPQDFHGAQNITFDYIDAFFFQEFELDNDTELLAMVGIPVGQQLDPVAIDFDFTAVFNETSAFIPSQEVVDTMIVNALSQPAVQLLLDLLRELPTNSPFSSVSTVTYLKRDQPQPAKEDSSIPMAAYGAMAATCVLVCAIGGMAVVRRKTRYKPLKSEFLQMPHQSNIMAFMDKESGPVYSLASASSSSSKCRVRR
jgi:hypothetical protein